MVKEKPYDLKRANVSFHFSERIKSELIIASKLLDEIIELKGDELEGAKNLLDSFLNMVLGEINLANNMLKSGNFEETTLKVTEAKAKMLQFEFLEATKRISDAISSITTIGQRAMKLLRKNSLI